MNAMNVATLFLLLNCLAGVAAGADTAADFSAVADDGACGMEMTWLLLLLFTGLKACDDDTRR
jgi:hypothetical protein